MSGIASEEHPAFAHLFGKTRVKGVDGFADDIARAGHAKELLKKFIERSLR